MSVYTKIDMITELPGLWKLWRENEESLGIYTSASFNDFLRREMIDGYVVPGMYIGSAMIKTEQYHWLLLKYT